MKNGVKINLVKNIMKTIKTKINQIRTLLKFIQSLVKLKMIPIKNSKNLKIVLQLHQSISIINLKNIFKLITNKNSSIMINNKTVILII